MSRMGDELDTASLDMRVEQILADLRASEEPPTADPAPAVPRRSERHAKSGAQRSGSGDAPKSRRGEEKRRDERRERGKAVGKSPTKPFRLPAKRETEPEPRDQRPEPQTDAAPPVPSPAPAVPVEPEEGVKVYTPRKSRPPKAEGPGADAEQRPGGPAQAEPKPEAPAPAAAGAVPSRRARREEAERTAERRGSGIVSRLKEQAGALAGLFRRREQEPPKEPEELPSFEELLYGKKEKPQRIREDEDEAPAPEQIRRQAGEPRARREEPAQDREPERPLSRRERRESEQGRDRSARRTKDALSKASEEPAESEKAPRRSARSEREARKTEPVQESEPTRAREKVRDQRPAAPQRAERSAGEAPAAEMSVWDILAEFRETDGGESASEQAAPRRSRSAEASKRESPARRSRDNIDEAPARRSREDRAQPAEAAPAREGRATDGDGAPRRERPGRARADRREAAPARPERGAAEPLPPQPGPAYGSAQAPELPTRRAVPPPVDAGEPAALFGFLRRQEAEREAAAARPGTAARRALQPEEESSGGTDTRDRARSNARRQRTLASRAETDPGAPPVSDSAARPLDGRRRELAPGPQAPQSAARPRSRYDSVAPTQPQRRQAPPVVEGPLPAVPQRNTEREDAERRAMSLDDILAEYRDTAGASPVGGSDEPREARGESALARMQREARSYIAQRRSEDLAGLPEEEAFERPAAPASPAAPARPAETDAPAPRAEAAPERRYRRPSDEIDPRFRLDGKRRSTMVFGDKEIDMSADEDYVPPRASAASAWEQEEREEREEKPGFFKRLQRDLTRKHRAGRAEPQDAAPAGPEVSVRRIPAEELEAAGYAPAEGPAPAETEPAPVRPAAAPAYAPTSPARPAAPRAATRRFDDEDLDEPAPAPRRRGRAPEPSPAPAAPAEEDEEAPAPRDMQSEGFDDRRKGGYAPQDFADAEEGEEGSFDEPAFPSFKQYLSALVSGLMVRVFGAKKRGADVSGTMEADDEDLGPEMAPGMASRYYGSFLTSLRLRLQIALALLAVMAWVALGLPVSGALRSAPVAAGLVLAMQLTILLLGLDVVTGAAVDLARGRFGAASLAVLSCILTSLDALAVCLGVLGQPHMPLCLISSISFLGVMLSSLVSARALRKTLRVPAIAKRCYAVTGEAGIRSEGLTLLKSLRPPKGMVRRSEEAAPDEEAFQRLAPILAILAIPLALVVAAVKHAFPDLLYIYTALLCPAVPFCALLCFALPFLFGALRIFPSGAAIAGWSGINDIGRSTDLVVTDRDLFPEGSVQIDTVRIFAEVQPQDIISYAGTMICASGSDLAPVFAELMERNSCTMRKVEGFELLSGGGMKGVIDGSVVLCGGVELMRLMNVRVPYRLVGKSTVLLSVDGILCGIFNMKYEGQPQVRKALVDLIRSNRHPIFAIRDFLVTPEMLSDAFDVATDGYDFPPYEDRFAISEAKPTDASKIAAVVCREGLGPLVHMADTGRSLYVSIRINLLLTILGAVLGVLAVFFRLLGAGAVGSGFLLLFLLVWALPVAAVSLFSRF